MTKEHLAFLPGVSRAGGFKKWETKSAHFAHKSRKVCTGFSEGEAEEHLQTSRVQLASATFTKFSDSSRGILTEICQRPDVLYETLAIEIHVPHYHTEDLKNEQTHIEKMAMECGGS